MSTSLSKGQNGPIPVTDLVVSIQLAPAADLSALLVTGTGNVRTDADFVFFNQPAGPGVQLVPGDTGQPARLAVALNNVPADIVRVRAVITLDDSNTTFGSYPPPLAQVSDATGRVLYDYRIEGLTTESIVIALELYRRDAVWKIRAVGQGYAGGFAALVTDHGVSVDDAPSPPPPPARTTPPPQPGAAPVSTRRPSPASSTSSGSEISLVKGRTVNLSKGQRVSLRKDGGAALTRVRMGLGWDPLKQRGLFGSRSAEIDLDASAVLFAGHELIDVCYYGQLTSRDGSIKHLGDNLTGEGEGDDETITVDLSRVPSHVTSILFIVTSYRGHTFDQLSNAFCRLIDASSTAELARYTLQGSGMRYTAMVMAKMFRLDGDWKLQAIGEGMHAKHPGEAAPQLARFL
ncbi:TerD family protein [Mycolicibacterium sp. 018/SC-01/001]|uniref:TerD family protein n=1 Tax=Mycolicibacterium sp. 018/SC-01/001 TaxID=2592069 RepID=UPI00118105BE|nr:TerD family protein [Mycolicibacterium sp. 018/SC-01/001]TRW86223.1 TerD family protein [Mycolicibacterium sp. 018/SC-01/001]